ncbi:MAG TPA: hypothetical protein V6D20_24540 [Candidatus Obscuribacterales bacterium]
MLKAGLSVQHVLINLLFDHGVMTFDEYGQVPLAQISAMLHL